MTTGKKIALGLGCAVPLICCAGGLLVVQGTLGKAASGRNEQLAAARREGIPLEPADIEATLRVSDADNAAPLYQKILKQFDRNGSMNKEMSAVDKGMSLKAKPEDVQAADAALAKLAPSLAIAEEAAKRPRCVWGRDWGKGIALLFPEFAPMKSLAKAFAFRARRQSARGDWQGALRSIAIAQKIGRHASDDPVLIGALVGIADEAIATKALEDIIKEHANSPQFLAEARKIIAGFGPLADLRRAYGAEVVMGRIAIQQLKSTKDFMPNPDGQGPSPVEQAFFSSKIVKDAYESKLIEAYRALIKDLPKDPEQWEVAERASREADARVQADHSVAGSLNQIMFPVFSQTPQAIGRQQMRRRLLETTLRLLQERARTGKLPDRLPDYGKVRIDPFSGDPFHYGRVGKGFRLYSVGVDRTDDDGQPAEPGRIEQNHDEVIMIK